MQVVVVRFKRGCKPYYFGSGGHTLEKGQGVIVETARGLEYAVVADPAREVADEEVVQPLKNVIRPATERDEAALAEYEARRPEALRICKEKIAAHGLPMKLIDCEFTFDGGKVVFTFTAESRVDFRDLVRDLASVFHMRIELRQVGIRDEARILGGIAPCGREVCCAGCMPDFRKVSIKMAKNQGLSLNPGKISGLCGRLMCCLSYEDEYYAAASKKAPRIGSAVLTPEGKGTVIAVNMLKMEVRVKIEQDGALVYRDFPADVLQRAEADRPAPRPQEREQPAQEEARPERTERLRSAQAQQDRGDRPRRGQDRHDRPRPERQEKPREDRHGHGGQDRGGKQGRRDGGQGRRDKPPFRPRPQEGQNKPPVTGAPARGDAPQDSPEKNS